MDSAEDSHSKSNYRAASSSTAEDQQFARFLEAADQLGGHLDTAFADVFLKIVVANAPQTNHADASLTPGNGSSGNVTRIEEAKRKISLREKPLEQPQSPSLGIESSLIVRLHFAEAMMVLMFNVLSEPQQDSIKRHFATLLNKSENLEVVGIQAETFQLYREALGAMQNMLASNPTPEEMAVALADDFAKRCSNDKGNGTNPPRSAG